MTRKRAKRNQYEARLIQLLKRRFEQARLKVQDHLKVGRLPLEIDMLVRSRRMRSNAIPARLPKLFRYFRQHNVLEIKTEQTPLKVGDLLKLQAYTWLYMEQRQVHEVEQVTATVIAHHLPASVRAALPALKYRRMRKGVYKNRSAFDSYLLDLSELPETLPREELQIFTNRARREKIFILRMDDPKKQALVDAMNDLYKSEVKKLMVYLDAKQKKVKRYVDIIGRKRVAAALPKEELLAALSKKDLLSALSAKDIIAVKGDKEALSVLLAKMGRERLLKTLDQISRRPVRKHQLRAARP